MRKELDEALCAKYPLIFRDRHENMQVTAMCWGFECGDGWYNIINTLCGLLTSDYRSAKSRYDSIKDLVNKPQWEGSKKIVTQEQIDAAKTKLEEETLKVPVAVQVIADMLTSSVIDPVEFENERTVILEELAMNDDDPQDVAHEEFFEAVLGGHPLGRPIGGTPATINAVSRDAVWDHYQRNYRPQDLVIAAAGGVDHDALLELVRENLETAGWDLNLTATPRPWREQSTKQLEVEPIAKVISRPIAQANIVLGGQGLVAGDERRYAMAILNTVLGGGMSSRLFQEIREKRGLAYSVYSFNQGYSDAAAFGLYAGCSPQKAKEVIKLMLAELEKVASEGITDAELDLAKGNISGGLALKFESTQARMSRLTGAELTDGEFIDLDESLRRYDAVSLADVQLVAKLMSESKKSFIAVGDVKDDLFDEFV